MRDREDSNASLGREQSEMTCKNGSKTDPVIEVELCKLKHKGRFAYSSGVV